MENNYTVYMHFFPNKKVYIGITHQRPQKRWGGGNNYYKQKLMYKAIQKYGWENVEHKILFTNLTKEEAEQKEIELIAKYKSNNSKYGYNITNGGNVIGTYTEEMKRKLSEAHKGKKHGPMSEQRKKKISEALKGKTVKETTREKYRQNTKKLWQNKNFRNNQIQKHIGKVPWNKGLKTGPMSEEQKEKLRHIQNKPVICLETQIIYYSITEAKRKTNICHISQVCLGNRKTAGGYHWEFINKEQN